MHAEELEKIVARHKMRCLELKESFNFECVEAACAFSLRGVRILPTHVRWSSRGGGGMV